MRFDPYLRPPNEKPLQAIVCVLCTATFTILGWLALFHRRISLGSPKGSRKTTYEGDAAVIAGVVLLAGAYIFARYMLRYLSGPLRVIAEIVVLAIFAAIGGFAFTHTRQ